MTDEEIKLKVKELIKENCFYDKEIKDEHDLFIDLYYDSLALSALITELDETFSITITKEEIEAGINTTKKIVDLIKRKTLNV